MKAVLQRVLRASVRVSGRTEGEIGNGLLVLLGIAQEDGEDEAARLAGKVARLRVFENDEGRLDRSLLDTGGEALVVSQFTLIADTRKGNRPSFAAAAATGGGEDAGRELLRCAARARRPGRDRGLRCTHGGRARERRPGDDHAGLTAAPMGRNGRSLLHFRDHFHLLDEMGAQRPFLLKEPRF